MSIIQHIVPSQCDGWQLLPAADDPDVVTAKRWSKDPQPKPKRAEQGNTVVICTYKRPDDLSRTLDSIAGRTELVREVRFFDGYRGYYQAEDLDFSLRMKAQGKIVLAGGARLQHLLFPGGRPNHYALGNMSMCNKRHLHRHAIPNRRATAIAWFAWAFGIDKFLSARNFSFPCLWSSTAARICGRSSAAVASVSGRSI